MKEQGKAQQQNKESRKDEGSQPTQGSRHRKDPRHIWHWRAVLEPILVFVLGLALSTAVMLQVYSSQSSRNHATAQSVAHSRSSMLLQLVEKRIAVANIMDALAFNNDGDLTGISPTMEEMFRNYYPSVTKVMYAPGGTVRYVYPKDGEVSSGCLFDDPEYGKLFSFSRASQRVVIHLVRGATGKEDMLVIYRPIYMRRQDTGCQRFWGFAIVYCPLESILKDSRILELPDDGYHYRLTMFQSFNEETTLVAQSDADWQDDHAEIYRVVEPGYTFTLSVSPDAGWINRAGIALTGGLLTLLCFVFTALVIAVNRARMSNRLLGELSSRDDLTGLPNRRSFKAAVQVQLARRAPLTVFFLDANHFKNINDTYGHQAGNAALTEYGIRLNEIFDGQAYRMGGDEFAGYVDEAMDEGQIAALVARVDSLMAQPFLYQGHQIRLSMAAGWSVPAPGTTYDDMMKAADEMMYTRKQEAHRREQEG